MNEQDDSGNTPEVLSEDVMIAANDFVSVCLPAGCMENPKRLEPGM